jgi:penicillin-binding protein 2
MASKSDLVASKALRSLHVPGMRVGKTGLEKSLNIPLIGEPGYQRFEVNAYGKRVKEIKLDQGESGKRVRTTLDLDLQNYAQEILKEKSGTICVMDIYTGGVIVMASSPTFDPNKFVHGIDSKSWKELIQNKNKPLMNKALSALYPPGSTIKPIVALSALENDVVNPKFKIFCTGSIELYGQKYHCWKKKGHGTVDLKKAIKESCDCYCYEIARRLGVDRLSVTAKNFGLGSKLLENYQQEEKSGIVPNTKWKLKHIGRSWLLGETLISGIGQGYFQCTPFQICNMTAQLANGGFKLKPKIVEDGFSIEEFVQNWKKQQENIQEKGYQNIEEFGNTDAALTLFRNQENIKFVQLAMYAATNEPMGTSYRSRIDNKKYRYAGKTGTSLTKKITAKQRELELKQSQLPYEERDHTLGFQMEQKP